MQPVSLLCIQMCITRYTWCMRTNIDLDDEFVTESEESQDYDKLMDRTERRVRPSSNAIKKGKAAWSKLEDVLAERRGKVVRHSELLVLCLLESRSEVLHDGLKAVRGQDGELAGGRSRGLLRAGRR